MNYNNPDALCSICNTIVGEEGYPLANNNSICKNCFGICGFSFSTATNCLSVEDVLFLLNTKNVTVEEIKKRNSLQEEGTEPKSLEELETAMGDNNAIYSPSLGFSPAAIPAPKSMEDLFQSMQEDEEVSPSKDSNSGISEKDFEVETSEDPLSYFSASHLPVDSEIDKVMPFMVEPMKSAPIEEIKTQELGDVAKIKEEPEVAEPLIEEVLEIAEPIIEENSEESLKVATSTESSHDSDNITDSSLIKTEDGEEKKIKDVVAPVAPLAEPKKTVMGMSKSTLVKIGSIVFIAVAIIVVVGSFLPKGMFFGKNDAAISSQNGGAIQIVAGEANEYSQKPKPEKDGYIYLIPEGTYTVTMLDSSRASQGSIAVESNTVSPSDDGKGYYENILTTDMSISQSVIITVEENQHIYLSIDTVVELVPYETATDV